MDLDIQKYGVTIIKNEKKMKLKDKIECTLERHVKLKENQSENIEKIAEDFAISFAEWITNSGIKNTDLPMAIKLKMYKNQKGL